MYGLNFCIMIFFTEDEVRLSGFCGNELETYGKEKDLFLDDLSVIIKIKDMKNVIKYLVVLLLCVPFGLKAQDVKFDIALKGTTLNYTVVNDTPNDIYLVQYGDFNPDRGSHCYVYYKDTGGYVGEVSFVLMEKTASLIKPGTCFSRDIDISELDRQRLVGISCRAAVMMTDEHDKPCIKRFDKSMAF